MIKPVDHLIKGLYPKEKNLQWKEPFYFIQASDPQFGLLNRWDYTEDGKPKKDLTNLDREKKLAAKCVQLVNQLKPAPKFMIICGDMILANPYKLKEGTTDGTMSDDLSQERLDNYKDFIDTFQKLQIPLVCICGNHDVGDKPTLKSIERYETEFGDHYYKFFVNGVLFICLNSQLFFDANECNELAEEQEKWLDQTLAEEAGLFKHVVVLQHHPLFTNNPTEEHCYYNLPISKRKSLLSKFKKANIKKVFTGHYHHKAGGFDENLECIVTPSIGLHSGSKGQNGFRIVKVEETDITHKYYNYKDCPKAIDF